MNAEIKNAMNRGGIADITTIGRRTGEPRRIEIYFHHFDGEYFLTGRPGRKRDWEANIEADPSFILHLKKEVVADVPVVGETDIDPEERARIIRRAMIENWNSEPERVDREVDRWVEASPFVRFSPAG